MALVISMLNTIFPLYTKTRNHHLKYPNVLRLISSWNIKLINNITVAISGCDALRPLGIGLGPSQIVYVTHLIQGLGPV